MSTIFAQSSRPGKAGVALFRVSGPKSLDVLAQLTNKLLANMKERTLYCRKVFSIDSVLIDNAMVAYFRCPKSFTGEDMFEIYTHGSIAITKMLTQTLLNLGVKLAEPGEFTKRAFLNNKFDLTIAEGIADLIEAETLIQHKQAMQQAEGLLGQIYDQWRQQLIKVSALLEAYIDFPDEDIPHSIFTEIHDTVSNLQRTLEQNLLDSKRGQLLKHGIKLSIIGPPNVGKSSLLNLLTQKELAIVSEISGTTRDIIEGCIDLKGYPIIIQDTAGIRDTDDIIEQEGVKRAINAAQNADIKILMMDATNPDFDNNNTYNTISYNTKSQIKQYNEGGAKCIDNKRALTEEVMFKNGTWYKSLVTENTIIIVNKIDLVPNQKRDKNFQYISVREKIGINELIESIVSIAENIILPTDTPYITQERHKHNIQSALECLTNFTNNDDLVLAVEDIRSAIQHLNFLIGKITPEEILGEIFGNFCIGK